MRDSVVEAPVRGLEGRWTVWPAGRDWGTIGDVGVAQGTSERVVELCHRTDAASGYGTLARHLRDGMILAGATVKEYEGARVMDNIRETTDDVELVQTQYGPRWCIKGTHEVTRCGSRSRRWFLNHREFEFGDGSAAVETVTRNAERIAASLPAGARYGGASTRALFTMWESSEIPTGFRSWVPHLKRPHVIIVPAEHSRRVILDQVPDADVRIVPLPLDGYRYVERPDRDTYTFLIVGDLSVRKGFHILYQAFWQAFEGRPDVKLVMKTRAGSDLSQMRYWPKWTPVPEESGSYIAPFETSDVRLVSHHDNLVRTKDRVRWYINAGDANVRVLRGDWSRRALRKLYEAADCFVWPTLGEGWGYPPREAAATGLPVITCAHTGQTDAADWAYVIRHTDNAKPAIFKHWGGQCGYWPLPDVDDLTDRMRWVESHREEAKTFGRKASEVCTRYTPADFGRDVLDVLASTGETYDG